VVWWIDEQPCPGPAFEADYEVEVMTDLSGAEYRIHMPLRDNVHQYTVPGGYNKPPKPGEVFVVNGNPVGIVLSCNYIFSREMPTQVEVQKHDFL